MKLVFEKSAWETMKQASIAGYPREVCGLLLGKEEGKVSKIEVLVQEIPQMKEDISIIKLILPTLATKKDLERIEQKLEKRLTALETH